MDQLAAEIMVCLPANAAEPRFSAGRVLARHKPDPGCQFAPTAKVATIINAGDQRGSNDRLHSG